MGNHDALIAMWRRGGVSTFSLPKPHRSDTNLVAFPQKNEPMNPVPEDLAALRREIDSIDEKLHDLLMQRGEVVAKIGHQKSAGGEVTFRPAREAQLLKRLLTRHRGDLPGYAVVRIWREIIAASIRIQGELSVGYCPIEEHGAALRLAKGYFGIDAIVVRFESASHVISAIDCGEVSVGLVPLPQASDVPGWWSGIRDKPDIHAVARLPWFLETADAAAALVVARTVPEASGDDRSLLMFSCPSAVNRARVGEACAAEGLAIVSQVVTGDPRGSDQILYLLEFEGFVGAEDSRIQTLVARLEASTARLLGAFARSPVAPGTAGGK
ncbi:MAG: chorismate mutase [Alphaproteobacteria bacterium]|nr:chorismate mutase [Alphaproteobacteria bacterium]